MDKKEAKQKLAQLKDAAMWNAKNGDPETAARLAALHNVVQKGEQESTEEDQ